MKIQQSCGQEARQLSERSLFACPPPTSDPSAVEAQAACRARDSVVANKCSFPGREKDIDRKRSKPTYIHLEFIYKPPNKTNWNLLFLPVSSDFQKIAHDPREKFPLLYKPLQCGVCHFRWAVDFQPIASQVADVSSPLSTLGGS